MTVLMKDALKPNLMQGLDNGPCLVHAGPFANIAIGTNSIVADRVALKLAIMSSPSRLRGGHGRREVPGHQVPRGQLQPSCVVVVATLKALKLHGGAFHFRRARSRDGRDRGPNPPQWRRVCKTWSSMWKTCRVGLPVVVAINRFPYDTAEEIEIVARAAKAAGAVAAVESHVHARGEKVERPGPRGRRGLQGSVQLQVPLRTGRADQGEDREDRDGIYGRRAWTTSPRPSARSRLSRSRPGQLAHLHGQDAPVAEHDPNLKGRPTASGCRSATCGPPSARASCIRCAAP